LADPGCNDEVEQIGGFPCVNWNNAGWDKLLERTVDVIGVANPDRITKLTKCVDHVGAVGGFANPAFVVDEEKQGFEVAFGGALYGMLDGTGNFNGLRLRFHTVNCWSLDSLSCLFPSDFGWVGLFFPVFDGYRQGEGAK
jgi:hypothetical protein